MMAGKDNKAWVYSCAFGCDVVIGGCTRRILEKKKRKKDKGKWGKDADGKVLDHICRSGSP